MTRKEHRLILESHSTMSKLVNLVMQLEARYPIELDEDQKCTLAKGEEMMKELYAQLELNWKS